MRNSRLDTATLVALAVALATLVAATAIYRYIEYVFNHQVN